MKTKTLLYFGKCSWYSTLAILVSIATQSAFPQAQIIYNSFNSGSFRSMGNNSMVISMLGQSVFGTSGANGISVYTGYTSFSKNFLSSVRKNDENIPTEFVLHQNYPNPFNPSTTITYSIPERSTVRLSIFNTLGQKVSDIVNEMKDAGSYEHNFNASRLSSGIYFYRIEATLEKKSGKVLVYTRKMILMK